MSELHHCTLMQVVINVSLLEQKSGFRMVKIAKKIIWSLFWNETCGGEISHTQQHEESDMFSRCNFLTDGARNLLLGSCSVDDPAWAAFPPVPCDGAPQGGVGWWGAGGWARTMTDCADTHLSAANKGERERERRREEMACRGWHQISSPFSVLSVSQEAHFTQADVLSVWHKVNYLHVDMLYIHIDFF